MKIYCVGTLAADFYISDKGSKYYIGGIASNVAIGLSKLGLDTTLITRIGNDTLGKILRDKLLVRGVNLLDKYSSRATPIILVQSDCDKEITYVTHFRDTSYAELYIPDFPSDLMVKSEECILVLNGTILQNKSVHTWLPDYISEFRRRGGLVVFDINWRDHLDRDYYHVLFKLLQQSDIIKGTPKEFSLLGETDPDTLIRQYFNDKICLLTKGSAGCTIYYRNNSVSLKPTPAERIVDPSGCGDAFVVGFIKGYLDILEVKTKMETETKHPNFIELDELVKCARLGNYLASKIIQIEGGNNYSDVSVNTIYEILK